MSIVRLQLLQDGLIKSRLCRRSQPTCLAREIKQMNSRTVDDAKDGNKILVLLLRNELGDDSHVVEGALSISNTLERRLRLRIAPL